MFACASPASAVLSLLSGTDVLQTAETCVLKYFGPQADEAEGPGVFLQGNELCDPDADAVRGKVVIGILHGVNLSGCDFMAMYRRLDAAGAVGFVKLVLRSPPGLYTTFDHDAWDTAESQAMRMTMVEVFEGDLAFGPKEATAIADFRVSLSPVHNTQWSDIYTSLLWLVGMRIIAPLLGLVFVSWAGFVEARVCWASLVASYSAKEDRALTEMRTVSFVACATSSACSFFLALLLVLGSWAAKMAPSFIHRIFATWLLGTTTSITLIACMVMAEKFRSAPGRNLPIRVLTAHYRWTLLGTLLGPVGDFVLGFGSAIGIEEFWGYKVAGVVCFLINISICAAFSYFAYALGGPLLTYMHLRGRTGNALLPIACQVSAVVLSLGMNVIFILLNGFIMILYIPITNWTHAPPVLVQVWLGCFILSRFGQLYWLVRAMAVLLVPLLTVACHTLPFHHL
jgi:hypothetical protein